MSGHQEYEYSASIYIYGRLHTVYGYARQGNTPITMDLLSDYYGSVTVRGRLFNVYGNRDSYPPRSGDLPSAVRMRFGFSSLHTDIASSSRRPYRRIRDLPRDRASSSTLRRAPPFYPSSRYEVPESVLSVPPDVPIAVENRDRSADIVRNEVPEVVVSVPPDVPVVVENRDRSAGMVLVYGPRGNMQVGRPAPLRHALPLGTVAEHGRSGPAATVLEPEPEHGHEAEGVLRAIGRRLWSMADDYNPFKRRRTEW